jgi:hypothetical protein
MDLYYKNGMLWNLGLREVGGDSVNWSSGGVFSYCH